ncbi:MAG: hypothetical protein ABIV06_07015 [Thermoanaerobaculia bacterium]
MTQGAFPDSPSFDGPQNASRSAALMALAPRFLTAGAYLAAWIVPASLPAGFVRAIFFGLILEFLLLHSYPFLNFLAGVERGASWGRRLRSSLVILGFGSFYLVMAVALGWATHSWTPLWTIAWLLGSRIFDVALAGEAPAAVAQSRTESWLRHLLLYIFLAVLTSIVPLPALGLSPEIVASFALPGSGSWIERPQCALAFGALYFGLGAWFDLRSRLRS